MNYKTTLLLLIALAAVVAVLVFTRDMGQPSTDAPASVKTLLAIASGEVEKLIITPAGQPPMVIVRDGQHWRLEQPVKAIADDEAVRNLLQELTNLRPGTPVEPSSGTGLESPRFVVELVNAAGASTTLRIGERSAMGQELYVQVAGRDQANLISAGVDESLDKPVNDFRDRKLFSMDREQIRQIIIDRPDGQLVLVKPAGEWTIAAPRQLPADASAISELLFGLTTLRADDFVQGDPASPRFGLMRDARSITLSTTVDSPSTRPTTEPARQTVTLLVGLPDDVQEKRRFAMIKGTNVVVKVSADSVAFLDRTANDLRDKKVVTIDPSAVNSLRLEIKRPATTQPITREAESSVVELIRRPAPATQPATTQATQPAIDAPASRWITADGKPANDTAIETLLKSLNPLRASKYTDAASAGGTVYTIKVEAGGGGVRALRDEQLQIVDHGTTRPAEGAYNDVLFEVDSSMIDKLKAKFDEPSPALPTNPMPEPDQP